MWLPLYPQTRPPPRFQAVSTQLPSCPAAQLPYRSNLNLQTCLPNSSRPQNGPPVSTQGTCFATVRASLARDAFPKFTKISQSRRREPATLPLRDSHAAARAPLRTMLPVLVPLPGSTRALGHCSQRAGRLPRSRAPSFMRIRKSIDNHKGLYRSTPQPWKQSPTTTVHTLRKLCVLPSSTHNTFCAYRTPHPAFACHESKKISLMRAGTVLKYCIVHAPARLHRRTASRLSSTSAATIMRSSTVVKHLRWLRRIGRNRVARAA